MINTELIGTIAVGILVAVIFVSVFLSVLNKSGSKVKLKPKPKTLIEAETALNEGHYEKVLIKSYSAIEFGLKSIDSTPQSSFEALQTKKIKSLLGPQLLTKAHNIRKLRNAYAHGENVNMSKQQSAQVLADAKLLLARLRFTV